MICLLWILLQQICPNFLTLLPVLRSSISNVYLHTKGLSRLFYKLCRHRGVWWWRFLQNTEFARVSQENKWLQEHCLKAAKYDNTFFYGWKFKVKIVWNQIIQLPYAFSDAFITLAFFWHFLSTSGNLFGQ